jgi:hypothetical protein
MMNLQRLAATVAMGLLVLFVSQTNVWAASNIDLKVGGSIVPPAFPAPALNTHVGGLLFNFSVPSGSNLDDMLLGNQGAANQTLANNVVAGFGAAGNLWSSIFSDPITINVDIDFDNLGAGILGSTGNNTIDATYAATRTALINDQTSPDDATAVAKLQPGPNLDFLTNDTSIAASPVFRDNDGSGNNSHLDIPRGNAKALGLLGADDAAQDGAITFSTTFNWDFARNPGAGQFDFVAVAAHEIGHLMGFVSGVDVVDYTGGAGPAAPFDLDDYRVFSVLDLYRYSAASLAEGGQPAPGSVLDLAYGDTPYFSINGGATNLGTFSTGAYNGDGNQASHWKDDLGLGIMDPTLAPTEIGMISALDIRAFDVIGYDLAVPEPAGIVVMTLGAWGLFGYTLRRRRRMVVSLA